jgi:hypothetical protein
MRVNILGPLIAIALVSGCNRRAAELASATHAFEQRYPAYVTHSVKSVKRDDSVMEVALQFEAPGNLKPCGLAALVFYKDTDGTWLLQEERIHMWPR